MDIKLAEQQVAEWAREYSNSLGLKDSNIVAKYIYNPGGFVNQSYKVSDGQTSRHVKFATERKAPCLKQWAKISEHLTNNYNAPRLVKEVTQEIVPGFSYGLVFELIEGNPLTSISNPKTVVQQVLKTLAGLHIDREIQKLIANERIHSYSDAFINEYITRFEEDLQIIRSQRKLLSFVSDQSLEWFNSEVESLSQLVRQLECFQSQAIDVVHNDINWENILVNDLAEYWMIDWDDLSVSGDAAMDYSVLLWPFYQTEEWPIWKHELIQLTDKETIERMEFYFRAKLLDDVIDVLTDYIEAEDIPAVKKATQKRAKEIHLRAYPEYLRRYGITI